MGIVSYLCLVGIPIIFYCYYNRDKYLLISNILFQVIETFWLYVHIICFNKYKINETIDPIYNSV